MDTATNRVLNVLLVALLATAGLLFAGCASPKTIECKGHACTPSPTDARTPTVSPTIPPTDPIIVPGNHANLTVVFEDCTGSLGNAQVPYDEARRQVPSAFLMNGWTPETATLYFAVKVCERVVLASTVYTNVSTFESSVFVLARNESWDEGREGHYVLDFRVSEPALVPILQRQGIDGRPATFRLEDTQAPGTGPTLKKWIVEDDNSSFAFQSGTTSVPGGREELDLRLWGGSGPFRATLMELVDTLDFVTPVVPLQMTGESRTRSMAGDNVASLVADILSRDDKWTLIEMDYIE